MCNGTARHFCGCIPISGPSSQSPHTLSSPHSKSPCLDLPDSRRSRPRSHPRPMGALHSLHTDHLRHWLPQLQLQLHRTVPVGGLPSQRRTVEGEAWAGGWRSLSFHLTSSDWRSPMLPTTTATNPERHGVISFSKNSQQTKLSNSEIPVKSSWTSDFTWRA